MLRSEIRTATRKRLGETTASFWSDVEINTKINEACKDIARRTKCIRTSGNFTPTIDVSEYVASTLFPGILSVNEVYFNLNGLTIQKLEATSRTELDALYPGWRSSVSNAPVYYYYEREEDSFVLYPPPNTDNANTDYGEVFYTKGHTDMIADTETPQLPDYLHAAVVDCVVATGYEERGFGDKANDAWQKYYSKLHDYQVERHREREDEEIIMKSYRNIYL